LFLPSKNILTGVIFVVHIMHMEVPDAVLDEVRPVLDILYPIFERAVAETQKYMQSKMEEFRGCDKELPLDPYVFSQLVRFHASELIDSKEFTPIGFLFHRLPNSGMYIEYKGYQVRIWKADEGQLPAPGNSLAKQDFYQQELFPEIRPRKLAVLWESFVNGAVSLILACPSGEGDPWQSGQSHWEITVPHPAQSIHADQANLASEDFDDLELVRKAAVGESNKG
jgi:hypothetical protein